MDVFFPFFFFFLSFFFPALWDTQDLVCSTFAPFCFRCIVVISLKPHMLLFPLLVRSAMSRCPPPPFFFFFFPPSPFRYCTALEGCDKSSPPLVSFLIFQHDELTRFPRHLLPFFPSPLARDVHKTMLWSAVGGFLFPSPPPPPPIFAKEANDRIPSSLHFALHDRRTPAVFPVVSHGRVRFNGV